MDVIRVPTYCLPEARIAACAMPYVVSKNTNTMNSGQAMCISYATAS